MTTDEMWALRDLLGMDVVLVPIPARQKGPRLKNWQKLTAADMDRDSHLQKLVEHANTGVLLGRASGGLCTIDIDDDMDLELFLEFNPVLKDTLWTRGQRGGNLWVRAGESAPPLTPLYCGDEPWGEWRGDGGVTVIAGIHPCGKPYQFVNRVPPMVVGAYEIQWPARVKASRPALIQPVLSATFSGAGAPDTHTSTASSESLYQSAFSTPSSSSASLHDNQESLALAIEAARAKQEFARSYPNLEPFYERWIGRIHPPKPGARNEALVTFVTFLAHCAAPEIVLRLALQFYDRNRAVWKDSREQHQQEASNHLAHVLARYPETLTADEAMLYACLNERTQTTFRICRDLASANGEETGDPTFFLSCQNLGHRTGLDPRQADRILKELESLQVIEVVKKGSARRKGTLGKATIYRWRLSLKPRPPATPAASGQSKPNAN
jgi:hypothetical protein